MPANFTYPGVYISEKPSGARSIPAAATSIAMFVGMADKGPFDKPTRVQSHADFARVFGEISAGEMALQVGQFFTNGGGEGFVMRIADNTAAQATVDLQDVSESDTLKITARDKGSHGNQIRVEVDYSTSSPERLFNLTIYRSILQDDGEFENSEIEPHNDLSMDPDHPRYVVNILQNEGSLVIGENLNVPPTPGTVNGASISGLIFATGGTAAQDAIAAAVRGPADPAGASNSFNIQIGNRSPVPIVIDHTVNGAGIAAEFENKIMQRYASDGEILNVDVTILTAANSLTGGRMFMIASDDGAVVISSAAENNLASGLMLGTNNGGIETDSFAALRPAPTGHFSAMGTPIANTTTAPFDTIRDFSTNTQGSISHFDLADPDHAPGSHAGDIALPDSVANSGNRIYQEVLVGTAAAVGSFNAVRGALDAMAAAITSNSDNRWTASRHGLRLVLTPEFGGSNSGVLAALTTPAPSTHNIGAASNLFETADARNVAAYSLGVIPAGAEIGRLQDSHTEGEDGNKPTLTEYQAAFSKIESDVEIFNMMVLPRAKDQNDVERKAVWGAASSFCAQQRAILFVDPEIGWTDIASAEAGADNIKLGVNTRHSVVYWPRLKIPTAETPSGVFADPSGSMAGLYARTDSRFGTWRAPAGIEATLTGVTGTSNPMSNKQQGVLNPKALNAIRIFPSGITSWGARMMVGADDTGNVDDKYINVRRMMLFIENSLYDGLRFAVFKNNAEPLWASIRLAAGSFMNGLMMQGAFASQTKSDAYYVLCDDSTTTANDINLGIVNIIVGFAPNKPAEFVHLTVTQIAGQTEV